MTTWSYSLVMSAGRIVAHDPSCRIVRALASEGVPVATLIDCQRPLPPETLRHSCLAGEDRDDAPVQ